MGRTALRALGKCYVPPGLTPPFFFLQDLRTCYHFCLFNGILSVENQKKVFLLLSMNENYLCILRVYDQHVSFKHFKSALWSLFSAFCELTQFPVETTQLSVCCAVFAGVVCVGLCPVPSPPDVHRPPPGLLCPQGRGSPLGGVNRSPRFPRKVAKCCILINIQTKFLTYFMFVLFPLKAVGLCKSLLKLLNVWFKPPFFLFAMLERRG